MTRTFKLLSLLLAYPTAELKAAAPDIAQALAAADLPEADRAGLAALALAIAGDDLYALQEGYVALFDQTRSLSLHLFEHVHGESRERGQAMVDLGRLYAARGLAPAAGELPDYLPLFLEFLSLLPAAEAGALLAETLHIVVALGRRLGKRGSSYAAVFAALETLAGAPPEEVPLQALLAMPEDDPNDLAALDRSWAEEPVSFTPAAGDAGCARATLLAATARRRAPATAG